MFWKNAIASSKLVWSSIYFQLFQSKAANNSITYVYQQLADNLGHITIGLLPTLILLSTFHPHVPIAWIIPTVVILLWTGKEFNDYRCAVTQNKTAGVFPLDTKDLVINILTALYYIGIGCILAYISEDYGWSLPTYLTIIGLTVTSIIQLTIDLKVKLNMDKAGVPYLSRLADFSVIQAIGRLDNPIIIKVMVESYIACYIEHCVPGNLAIKGVAGVGKNKLANAIANELAIVGKAVRYVAFNELYNELVHDTNTDYWPIEQVQCLIITDLPTCIDSPYTDMDHAKNKLKTIIPKLTSIESIIYIVDGTPDTNLLDPTMNVQDILLTVV